MNRSARTALAALVLIAAAGAAFAEEAEKKAESDASDYLISIRARWWMPVLNGAFQINKHDLKGSYNDFVGDMDLDSSYLDPRINGGGPDVGIHVQLGGFSAGLSYTSFFTGGKTVLEKELEIDINKFDSGDWINSDLSFAFGRADMRFELLDLGIVRGSAALGLDYFDFTSDIIGHDSGTGTEVAISDGGNGLYPVIGAVAEASLSILEGRAELFCMAGDFKAIGDIRLYFVDFSLSGHVRPWKYVSFGLGFRVVHLDASAINIWHGDPDPVRLTLYGLFFEIEGRF